MEYIGCHFPGTNLFFYSRLNFCKNLRQTSGEDLVYQCRAQHLLQQNINGGLQENASPVIYFSYQTTHIYIYTIAIKIVQSTTFFSANGHKLHFFLSQFNLQ